MSRRPALIVHGDPRHGVALYARQLAGAVRELAGGPAATATPPPRGAAHLHFTDRLWGENPEDAAARISRLANDLTLTVTLHDVPQASDGAGRLPARVACYRRIVDSAAGVVCNSHHEVALLREVGVIDDGPDPAVIPLPIILGPGPGPTAAPPHPEVALLGFVYPGKGHAEAVAAVAGITAAARPEVVALGGAAPGHEAEPATLAAVAAGRGVRFSATGWLSETALHARCRTAAVPLAAHRHISASGSIGSWIAAGRRPLVVDSRYARELEALRPGTITVYDPARLTEALAAALDDRGTTELDPAVATRPHLRETAETYLDWWARR